MNECFEKQGMNRKSRKCWNPRLVTDCWTASCNCRLWRVVVRDVMHSALYHTLSYPNGCSFDTEGLGRFFKSGPIMRRNHTGPVKTIMSTTESMYRQLSPFFSCSHYKKTKVRFVYDCNQAEDNRQEDFETASKKKKKNVSPRNF